MAIAFSALEGASTGSDASEVGTESLGTAEDKVVEGAGITTCSAEVGMAVETAEVDGGSVAALGPIEGAEGSTKTSEGGCSTHASEGGRGGKKKRRKGGGAEGNRDGQVKYSELEEKQDE